MDLYYNTPIPYTFPFRRTYNNEQNKSQSLILPLPQKVTHGMCERKKSLSSSGIGVEGLSQNLNDHPEFHVMFLEKIQQA
jgi:hypothetical protein